MIFAARNQLNQLRSSEPWMHVCPPAIVTEVSQYNPLIEYLHHSLHLIIELIQSLACLGWSDLYTEYIRITRKTGEFEKNGPLYQRTSPLKPIGEVLATWAREKWGLRCI